MRRPHSRGIERQRQERAKGPWSAKGRERAWSRRHLVSSLNGIRPLCHSLHTPLHVMLHAIVILVGKGEYLFAVPREFIGEAHETRCCLSLLQDCGCELTFHDHLVGPCPLLCATREPKLPRVRIAPVALRGDLNLARIDGGAGRSGLQRCGRGLRLIHSGTAGRCAHAAIIDAGRPYRYDRSHLPVRVKKSPRTTLLEGDGTRRNRIEQRCATTASR